jgi:hypothetical protein
MYFDPRKEYALHVFKYPSRQYTGQLLKIREECWQVIDVKCCMMALVMLS